MAFSESGQNTPRDHSPEKYTVLMPDTRECASEGQNLGAGSPTPDEFSEVGEPGGLVSNPPSNQVGLLGYARY